MALSNSKATYGSVTKGFHWLTALLIVTVIPLGVVAHQLPYDTSEALARKALLFSLHKTIGVAIFFTALLRILWALGQTKPGLLNAERRAEAWLAELVHWLLYGSLLLVPLTGWIHHAATTGFAPIWWPLGQNLPFVPKDAALAQTFAALHKIFERVMVAALLLHIAGALKHHFIDKDVTLKRMWFGRLQNPVAPPAQASHWTPLLGAGAVWAAALAIGTGLGLFAAAPTTGPAQALEAPASQWQVQDGTLAITITQLGSPVTGSFADWTADITFNETASNGSHGSVTVVINIASLTLGSVTDQALGPEFFDAAQFATAEFAADLKPAETGYLAEGTLTLRGTAMPLTLPFTLTINDDTAEISGIVTLDRRDFGIGTSYNDESSVNYAVEVQIDLTATRNTP